MFSGFLLIHRIRNGDRQDGNQFVEKYYSSIYQYCFYISTIKNVLRILHRKRLQSFLKH